MPKGDLEVVPFARPLLDEQSGDGAGTDDIDRYLTALEAKTCIVESHCIDRHYLDDVTRYFAKSLNSPEPYCSRLLFFSLDSAAVELELNRALGSATGPLSVNVSETAAPVETTEQGGGGVGRHVVLRQCRSCVSSS